jgi:peptidoglycan/xylan/chitin deacetylase (PgdA/CDA1 family)
MDNPHPISPLGPVKMAITIDDMLLFRGVPTPPRYTPFGNARAISSALKSYGVRDVYAFSNTAPAEDDPELLKVFDFWVENGHHVANHTHHHASINWLDAATYVEDIERAEQFIGRWIACAPKRYFRFCMDMWGDTAEKREAVTGYLDRVGYTPVPVSIGFHDARWMAAYWRTVKRDDKEGISFMHRAYIESAVRELRVHAANARAVFGRDPVHIWLIHGTPLGGDCLSEILERFEEAGVDFVSLETAMKDPMNAMEPPRISPEFLHQVEKWALFYGVPVDDRHPHIIDEIEKLNPAPGESSADIWKKMTDLMAQRVGARITPFPLAACQH